MAIKEKNYVFDFAISFMASTFFLQREKTEINGHQLYVKEDKQIIKDLSIKLQLI